MSNSASAFSLTDGVLSLKGEAKSLSTWVPGPIINPFTRQTGEQRKWKLEVACVVKIKRIERGEGAWCPRLVYAVTLQFRFHRHPNQKLDVDNYVKPVLDGLAAGLFWKGQDLRAIPSFAAHHGVDDSNFRILLIQRLGNAETPEDEGVRVFVSTNGQIVENGDQ